MFTIISVLGYNALQNMNENYLTTTHIFCDVEKVPKPELAVPVVAIVIFA